MQHICRPDGDACRHAPRSVAAAFACERVVFLWLSCLIFSVLACFVALVNKYNIIRADIFTEFVVLVQKNRAKIVKIRFRPI